VLNTDQKIQASTNNTIGLMATPATLAPCRQADHNRKVRITLDKPTGPHPEIARLEADRQAMRDAGAATPAYEGFMNVLINLVASTGDPKTAVEMALMLLSYGPPPAARTWTYTRRGDNAKVAVTCPAWCTASHEMNQYRTETPEDIRHQVYGREATVEATDNGTYEDWRILGAQLDAAPDAEDLHYRQPHVMVELVDDVWSRPMGPEQLAGFIDTVAGQLEELRKMHARLVQVRAENGETTAAA
jgi:hypothetical protein